MSEYDFAVQVVKEAGQRLLAARTTLESTHKGDDMRDIITNVDVEVNDFLIKKIQETFPSHDIVSEEGGVSQASEYQWAIDPIDGSANFSRAIPHFAICLGLLQGGTPVVGAIYNPITSELFSFEQGKGAFLNGAPIAASKIESLEAAQAFLTVGRDAAAREWGGELWKVFLGTFNKTKGFGASALDLSFLAAGRVEVVVYGRLTGSDIAAAVGLVRAAGGDVYTLAGLPIELSDNPQPIVATANKALLQKLVPLLRQDLLPS